MSNNVVRESHCRAHLCNLNYVKEHANGLVFVQEVNSDRDERLVVWGGPCVGCEVQSALAFLSHVRMNFVSCGFDV